MFYHGSYWAHFVSHAIKNNTTSKQRASKAIETQEPTKWNLIQRYAHNEKCQLDLKLIRRNTFFGFYGTVNG